jgi:hypothetical protein
MMKTLMTGAAFALLLGGAALADPASPVDPTSPVAATAVAQGGTVVKAEYDQGGPRQDGWRHGRHGWGQHGGKDGPDGRRFGGGHGGMMLSKGPGIFLEHKGSRITVKCAENDSTQQCVDAVKDLMGSIAQAMHRGGPGGDHPGYRGPQGDGPQGKQQDDTPDDGTGPSDGSEQ